MLWSDDNNPMDNHLRYILKYGLFLEQILKTLEKSHSHDELTKQVTSLKEEMQLSFFQLDDPVLEQIGEEIKNIDVDNLTPVEALMKLNQIKKLISK